MELGTDFVAPDQRIADNDNRTAIRWTERPDEDGASDGWTWVAALLVAALFIVSGYWDREAGDREASNAAGGYTQGASTGQVLVAGSNSDKGY